MSLPRLSEGDNPLELRTRDKHGLCTVPWSELIDFRAGADLAGRWSAAENAEATEYREGWQKIAPTGNGPVSATFRFEAPPGGQFAWAYFHASLNEGPADKPPGRATLQYSADGEAWREIAEVEIANTPRQWDCSIDAEARFPEPLGAVHLRIVSDTPISGVEFHGHLRREPLAGESLRIVHRWREGKTERAFAPPAGATRYVIRCGKDPQTHTIEMHAPSIPPI